MNVRTRSDAKADAVVDAHVIIDVVVDAAFVVDVHVIIDGILMAMEEVRWPTTLFISRATSNHFIQGIISFDMFLSSSSPISSSMSSPMS